MKIKTVLLAFVFCLPLSANAKFGIPKIPSRIPCTEINKDYSDLRWDILQATKLKIISTNQAYKLLGELKVSAANKYEECIKRKINKD